METLFTRLRLQHTFSNSHSRSMSCGTWSILFIALAVCNHKLKIGNHFFRQASGNWSENLMQVAHRHTQAIECTLRWHDRSMHHVFRHTKLIISQLSIKWKWQIDSIDQRDIPHLFHVKCIWAAAFLFLFFLRIRLRVCVIENWINYVRC